MALHGLIKVNEETIGQWVARRTTATLDDDGTALYDCYAIVYAEGPSRADHFELRHRYDDGALVLASKVLAAAVDQCEHRNATRVAFQTCPVASYMARVRSMDPDALPVGIYVALDEALTCPRDPTTCGRCTPAATDTPPCAWCKNPARGLATIGDQRYCHDGDSPTCYELAQQATSNVGDGFLGRALTEEIAREPIIRHATLDDGTSVFDEFVGYGVDIHFEAMGQAQWWMSIRHPDGRMWFINCGAINNRAKGYANCELVEQADPQPRPTQVELREDEAEQILRAAGDPNLPDDVFDVVASIVGAHVASTESARVRAMHSRAEWRRRAQAATTLARQWINDDNEPATDHGVTTQAIRAACGQQLLAALGAEQSR